MASLRAVFNDLFAALLTVFGTLLALAFTAGVVEGAFEAADVFEAIIGLVFGGGVALVAAGILALLATWQILRIGAIWHAALFDVPARARGGAGAALFAAVSDFVVGLLVALLGGLRLLQGVRLGEAGFAQQGALLLVAALTLGFGAGLGRLGHALRLAGTARKAAPRRREGGDATAGELAGADEKSDEREWSHFVFAYAAALGIVLAAVVSLALAALDGDGRRSHAADEAPTRAPVEAAP